MNIRSIDIKINLDKEKISYEWKGFDYSKFTIASLFNPVSRGFYFFVGLDSLPNEIKNSLVLVCHDFKSNDDSNDYIYLEKLDPQIVYYKILSNLFSRKSNGKISSLTEINEKAILGKNVQIDSFSILEEVVIGDNVIIGSNVKIHAGTKIGNNVIIESGSIIGAQGVAWIWDEEQKEKIIQPQLGGVSIKNNSFLGAGTIVVRGSLNEDTIIGRRTVAAPGCRFGHGTIIGDYCHFANNVTTGGNTIIGEYSFMGSSSTTRPKVKIHAKSIIGAGALVVKNTSGEGKTLMGVPSKEFDTNERPSGMPKPKI